MGEGYNSSLEAIFASVGSGELIHRFEVFLLALYTVCAIYSASFALCVSSDFFCRISNFNDSKPYILILAVIMYYLIKIDFGVNLYLFLTAFIAIVTLIFPVVIILRSKLLSSKGGDAG